MRENRLSSCRVQSDLSSCGRLASGTSTVHVRRTGALSRVARIGVALGAPGAWRRRGQPRPRKREREAFAKTAKWPGPPHAGPRPGASARARPMYNNAAPPLRRTHQVHARS